MGAHQNKQPVHLRFIQVLDDPHFGTVNTYRQEEKPYGYFMKICVTIDDNNSFQTKQISSIISVLQNQAASEFVPQLVQPIEQSYYCGHRQYTLTISYQNHTLRDFCTSLLSRSQYLTEGQICYIACCVITLYKVMEANGLYEDITPDKLFVTPQGRLIFYPFQLKKQNNKVQSLVPDGCGLFKIHQQIIFQQCTINLPQILAELLIYALNGNSPLKQSLSSLINKIYLCRNNQQIQQLYPWTQRSSECLILPAHRPQLKQVNHKCRESQWSGSTQSSNNSRLKF